MDREEIHEEDTPNHAEQGEIRRGQHPILSIHNAGSLAPAGDRRPPTRRVHGPRTRRPPDSRLSAGRTATHTAAIATSRADSSRAARDARPVPRSSPAVFASSSASTIDAPPSIGQIEPIGRILHHEPSTAAAGPPRMRERARRRPAGREHYLRLPWPMTGVGGLSPLMGLQIIGLALCAPGVAWLRLASTCATEPLCATDAIPFGSRHGRFPNFYQKSVDSPDHRRLAGVSSQPHAPMIHE